MSGRRDRTVKAIRERRKREVIVWNSLPTWVTYDQAVRTRLGLKPGITWVGSACWACDEMPPKGSGAFMELTVARGNPTRDEQEAEARRLLVYHIKEANHRRRLDLERRLAEQGGSAMSLAEMRELLVLQGKDPDEVLRAYREKKAAAERAAADAAEKPVAPEAPPETGSDTAGAAPEEK